MTERRTDGAEIEVAKAEMAPSSVTFDSVLSVAMSTYSKALVRQIEDSTKILGLMGYPRERKPLSWTLWEEAWDEDWSEDWWDD